MTLRFLLRHIALQGFPELAAIRRARAVLSNVQEDADARHADHQRCAAVADERQRHADDRQEAADHQKVDDRLTADEQQDARSEKLSVSVRGGICDARTIDGERRVEHEHENDAQKACLLAEYGEGEIRM